MRSRIFCFGVQGILMKTWRWLALEDERLFIAKDRPDLAMISHHRWGSGACLLACLCICTERVLAFSLQELKRRFIHNL
jgi:hypothetical protein